jgi:alkanesulfonate monooxygenase SsuD/methylene tetrahydromethanopterin reductase-like flavin-dependent oxidoreductase (luciferase family)
MLELTARYADGWNCSAKGHRAGYIAAEYRRMLDACERVGRDPATLTLTAQVETHVLVPGESKRDEGGVMVGTVEEVAEMLQACVELGVEHLMIVDDGAQDGAGVERLGRVCELFGRP